MKQSLQTTMIRYSIMFIILIGYVTCTRTTTREYDTPKRINIIEGSSFTLFMIVEVDGHQYLSRTDAGIVHLESCPCKTK